MKALTPSFAGLLLGVLWSQGASAATETVIYSFCSNYQNFQCLDGYLPEGGLIDVKGMLYGTTVVGGAQGKGTAFSLDATTGSETVLHSFGSGTDGVSPSTSLVKSKSRLYGTTVDGGAQDLGTVFSIGLATGTAETVRYSFGGTPDGNYPDASVIDIKGTLYGTTAEGGAGTCYGSFTCGTLFSLDLATGTETVLYSFCTTSACPNGAYPHEGLIAIKGVLYGTTESGGAYNGGTVFAFDAATGTETVLHSFGSGTDGNVPYGGQLIGVDGLLYGTTIGGGAHGDGTVFSVDTKTGAERVIYSFCSQQTCADGSGPFASVLNVNGILYGTTRYGGAYGTQDGGFGTVYSLDPKTGIETVLHSFGNGTDGSYPEAGLIGINGTLYGVTYGGGAHNEGAVFAIAP